MPRFETYCLETAVKTLVTETGQQLPPSICNLHYVQIEANLLSFRSSPNSQILDEKGFEDLIRILTFGKSKFSDGSFLKS